MQQTHKNQGTGMPDDMHNQPLVSLALLHQVINKADRKCLISLDALASKNELLGSWHTHKPWQALRRRRASSRQHHVLEKM